MTHLDSTCYRQIGWLVLAISVGLVVGCWQVVEHAEQAPQPTPPAPRADEKAENADAGPVDVTTDAREFADEFAESLLDEPPYDDPVVAAPDRSAAPADEQLSAGESSAEQRYDSFDDFLFGPLPERSTEDRLATPAPPPEAADADTPEYGALDELVVVEPPQQDEEPGLDDAVAVPAEISPAASDDVPHDAPPIDTADRKERRAAWLLGSKLSLAAVSHGGGAPGDAVQRLMDQSRSLARLLGVEVPNLPARPIGAIGSREVGRSLEYLRAEGQDIGRELNRRHGDQCAALFNVAMASNTLLASYRPGSSDVEAISDAITQAAPRSPLPAELWQPLVDLLARQAPHDEVQAAVYRLHEEADRYLAGASAR